VTKDPALYALFLKDRVAAARIGAHDFERKGTQRLVVNVALAIRGAAPADDLASAVDYDFLRQAVAQILAGGHVELQETVCARLLDICKSRPSVAAVRISTEKPDVYPDTAGVGCRMLWFADDVSPAVLQLLFAA
jgi:dihydroneopterin aldolase